MKDEACFYTLLRSPRERHDGLLLSVFAPVVEEIRSHPSLDSFFFVRYQDPDWQLRFRVLGRSAWIRTEVQPRIVEALAPAIASGTIRSVEHGEYAREWDRYGGERGMRLAEKVFLHDSSACIDLIAAEARGAVRRSRREIALLQMERLLDGMALDGPERQRAHRLGYEGIREEAWTPEDLRRLEERYASLRSGIDELLDGDGSDEVRYGGPEPAAIGEAWERAMQPVLSALLAAHAEGAIHQDLVHLAWSYTHMQCNRLGIEPVAEAILRYFLHRHHEERAAR
jgi:thiopeptide-type bacteriocin biosynthesis protein